MTQPACEPHTGTKKGVILSNLSKGLIVLHELKPSGEKDALVRLEPVVGETFVTVETAEECSIGEKIPIIGKLYIKDCENRFKDDTLSDHLIEQGPLTELWAFNKTTEHIANIDGSALVHLVAEHLDLPWAGLPA